MAELPGLELWPGFGCSDLIGDAGRFAADRSSDVLEGEACPPTLPIFMAEAGSGREPIFRAGDLSVSFMTEEGARRAGDARLVAAKSGGLRMALLTLMVLSSSSTAGSSGRVGSESLRIFMGLFFNGFTGVYSPASSSSDSSSLGTGICVTFLGLKGFASPEEAPFVPEVATAFRVLRAAVADPPLLTAARPRKVVVPGSLALDTGSTFSLPGSWKVTDFLAAVRVAVGGFAAVARARVVLVTGSGSESSKPGSWSRSMTLLVLVRVALGAAAGAAAGTSAEIFLGLPLVGFAAKADEDAAGSSGIGAFLGRPLVGRLVMVSSSSPSAAPSSSARVFRLVAAVLLATVALDDLACAAAVTILVVLMGASLLALAALARVTLFGGDSMLDELSL